MRSDKYFLMAIEKIKEVLNRVGKEGMVLYLFGSSVRDDFSRTSDIDLAIENADRKTVTLLRAEFEELNIPYKIDLVDLSTASEKLKEEILKTGVVIWRG